MKAWKIGVAGLVLMVFRVISGKLFSGGVFSWVYQLEPVNVWKRTAAAPSIKFYVAALVLSIAFAWVFALLQKGIPGGNKIVKGLVFGLCIWTVGMLPVMVMLAKILTVAKLVVIYWTVKGLVMIPVSGAIVAVICGDTEPKVKV